MIIEFGSVSTETKGPVVGQRIDPGFPLKK
jgi:hypothetical protein